MQEDRKGTKVIKFGKVEVRISNETYDDLDRCTAIIGSYGCEKTGYPYKTRINKGAIAEYTIRKYLKELEEKTKC